MPLSPEKTAAIRSLVEDVEGADASLLRVAAIETAAELQYLANYWNWNDGFALPMAIANHSKCDLGTALTLFWLAEPIPWYTREIEPQAYNQDWVGFCQLLFERIRMDWYQIGEVSFTSGLNVSHLWKYRKLGIPEVFLRDFEGTGGRV